MSRQTAIKLHVEIGADHTIRLPDNVPPGSADIIVLADAANGVNTPPEALGLFKDDTEVLDRAMELASDMRARSRVRSGT